MQIENGGGANVSGAENTHAGDNGPESVVSLIEDGSETESRKDGSRDERDSDSQGEGSEDERSSGRSRSQRYKERISRLTAELEAERRRSRAQAAAAHDDDLVAPREEDFPNDYLAYDRAVRDFQIRRALRDERRRDLQAQVQLDAEAAFQDKLTTYNERLDSVKSRIPDFETVLQETGHVQIRNDVRDLILGSTKGPLIAYYLAKHPDALREINRMPPNEAARRIGNIEARIRGPNSAAATRTEAPFTPLRGGASASRTLNPDRMSHDDYRKARSEGRL